MNVTRTTMRFLLLIALLLIAAAALAGSPQGAAYLAQTRLAELGHDPGPADGLIGLATRAALESFQAGADLDATGALDAPTLEALGITAKRVLALLEDWLDTRPEGVRYTVPQIERTLSVVRPSQPGTVRILPLHPEQRSYEGPWTMYVENRLATAGFVDVRGTRWLVTGRGGPGTNVAWLPFAFNESVSCDAPGSLTLSESDNQLPHILLEFEGGSYPPYVLDSSGGFELALSSQGRFTDSSTAMIPVIPGSIHRFSGRVELQGYVLEGIGDERERLTFLVTDDGWMYLRGSGKVTLSSGDEIAFPDSD